LRHGDFRGRDLKLCAATSRVRNEFHKAWRAFRG
jgi:hypothetical protein